jgi:putative ABC transport system ATP-binding protein
MSAADLAVSLRDLRFAWPGKPMLLDIAAFQLARGERVFLRGPSGSGKSTLLGLIGGVLDPSSGEVRVLGTVLGSLSRAARDEFRGEHLGFVFQMFNLIPYLGVLDNVVLPLDFSPRRAAKLAGRDARAEARRLLAALGLDARDLLERPVTQLSIGQQQRVAAARALLGAPEIVVADEPTSALDHDARAQFLDLLQQQCRALNTALLFVSHDTSLSPLFDRSVALDAINHAASAAAHASAAA